MEIAVSIGSPQCSDAQSRNTPNQAFKRTPFRSPPKSVTVVPYVDDDVNVNFDYDDGY